MLTLHNEGRSPFICMSLRISLLMLRGTKAPQNLGVSPKMTHHEVQYFADVVDGACNRRGIRILHDKAALLE